MTSEPLLNDKFPIGESLSPPVIHKPVYECAEAVRVGGFVPHATVRVIANGGELLAEENPPFGFADVPLARPLALGDTLVATQTVGGMGSGPSAPPVAVEPLPESAVRTTKPDVGDVLYECGRVVPVGNLVPGCRVHVYEDGVEVGSGVTAGNGVSVVTAPLHAGASVTARQIACEGSDHEVVGPLSDPVQVSNAPVPTPPPTVDPATLVPGNNAVTLRSLLVGAGIEIFDGTASIASGWLANAEANYFPVSPPVKATSSVSAVQELCGRVSPPSPPVTPTGELAAPKVVGPICAGARFVLVRDTVINATVVVLRNGQPVAYGGAAPGDVVLQLGGNMSLNLGDVITAVQYMGPTVSPTSAAITVTGKLTQPSVEIFGGHPFFLPKGNEKPINGPVFPRGAGPGPRFGIQTCCVEGVDIRVLDPAGKVVAKPTPVEVYPGYFTAAWPWQGPRGSIPVGRYTVVVRSPCAERESVTHFSVIFDPAEVDGPARFSFDATAVWFGTAENAMFGLHYYLHPSDARVFGRALAAVSGMTDAHAAAIALARAEEALFTYSLNYHTQDVVDLLDNYTAAQCADDACCLVAFLRSVGIPAHPVTADAGLETGAAGWTFDTWVEFLSTDGSGVIEWRVLHPHEYPGMQPESRGTFGTTRGVAVKSFNDVIVRAGESWVAADIDDGSADGTFGRNACGEPEQSLSLAPWVDELCENGYWPVVHWDCTGVTRSGLTAGAGFRIHTAEPQFGGVLSGTVEVTNPGVDRRFGVLTVELVGCRMESMAPFDRRYAEVRPLVALDSGARITVPFTFELPPTHAPYERLVLRARLDERVAVDHEVRIAERVEVRVDWPSEHAVGDRSTMRISVTNPSDSAVHDVALRVVPPHALTAWERATVRLGDLAPGEHRDVEVTMTADAPLDSGSVHVTVSSADGGSRVARNPVRIAEAPRPAPALPPTSAR